MTSNSSSKGQPTQRKPGQPKPTVPTSVIAGLDIGTTKVCVVIGRVSDNQNTEIIGVAQSRSLGLRKGVVINIDATVEAIGRALEDAELMAGVEIEKVWAGVAGSHITSFNSKGMVAIKHHEVQKDDIRRVIEAAQAVALPEGRQILHVLPQNFAVDNQDGIRDPLGMSGVRLEAGVHIVSGNTMSLQNISKCASRAGLHISGLVSEALASAEATLSQDEKDLGVAVIDMGGGTCDMVIYVGGSVVHTAVLPIGGSHLTHDISVGLRTPANEAEEIKRKFGCAMASLIQSGETMEVPSVGGRNPRTLSRLTLAEVIEPRIEETMHLLNNEIFKSGYKDLLGSGVVLTGGGSLLEGIAELSEFIFEMPVRRGIPLNTSGLREVVQSPALATAVGLLKFGAANQAKANVAEVSMLNKFFGKVTTFLDGAF
jgi:cell division protein FtsA